MRTPFFFQRRFLPMWTALSLGALSDNMLRQALIIGIAFGGVRAAGLDNPNDAIPIVGAFFAIAMMVFAPMAGQIAEKYETSMLFRRIKFVEVILMAVAALGFFLNAGWLLIATLFLMGAQSAFFSPVRMSAMPKYLRPEELVRGNGLCNAGLYVSILLGLFIGGLLIAEPGGRMKVAGLLFAASLTGWLAVLNAPRAAANAPELKIAFNPFLQTSRMIGFVLGAPGVVRPLFGAAFFFYASTMVTLLVPLYAKAALGAGEGVATAIMGIFAIGVGLGAISAAGLAKRRTGLGFSALGILLAALASLSIFALTPLAAGAPIATPVAFFTLSPAGLALAAAFCADAAFMGLYVVPLQAAAQRRAPPHERARILAASNMLNAAAAIAGSLSIFGVTRTGIDPALAFVFAAALQGAVGVYMLRRRARVPHGLFDESLAAPVEKTPAPTLPAAGARG